MTATGTTWVSPRSGLGDHDDDALAARAAQGDRRALELLLEKHADRIHAVCRRVVADREDALDATQEAMIAVAGGTSSSEGWASNRPGTPAPGPDVHMTMTDDDARDERLGSWLEVEPLDEVTRRRLVSSALDATPEPATGDQHDGRSWHALRWI